MPKRRLSPAEDVCEMASDQAICQLAENDGTCSMCYGRGRSEEGDECPNCEGGWLE